MTSNYSEKIAITTGDPNGIGAEITIKALNFLNIPPKDIVIISNHRVLNNYAKFMIFKRLKVDNTKQITNLLMDI